MSTYSIGLDTAKYEASPADNQLLDWNFDPADVTNSIAPTAGVLTLSRMFVPKTITVSNLVSMLRVAGTGATSLAGCYVGIYSSSGTLLGQSTDQSSAWSTLGSGTAVAALTPTSSGSLTIVGGQNNYIYTARLIVTQSTTAAQFGARSQGQAIAANVGLLASSTTFTSGVIPRAIQLTGQTSLATPITVNSSAAPGVDYWYGLS
jgi:hypothetical protein